MEPYVFERPTRWRLKPAWFENCFLRKVSRKYFSKPENQAEINEWCRITKVCAPDLQPTNQSSRHGFTEIHCKETTKPFKDIT